MEYEKVVGEKPENWPTNEREHVLELLRDSVVMIALCKTMMWR